MTPTPERLALALEEISAPAEMISAARAGRYDEAQSTLVHPLAELINKLWELGPAAKALVHRVIDGEFDATDEEVQRELAREKWKEVS